MKDDADKTRELYKELYNELGTYERHLNQMQHQYRVLASTWLLAAFAGTGTILSQELGLTYREPVIVAIALFGAVGITLLWNLDLRVYHQLLEACFAEGLKLERQHVWLPRMRSNMLHTQNDVGALPRLKWFYIAGNAVVLLVGGLFLARWSYNFGGPLLSVGVALSALGVIFIWNYLIHRNTSSSLDDLL